MSDIDSTQKRRASRPRKINKQIYVGLDDGLDAAINQFCKMKGINFPDFARQAFREKLTREVQKDAVYQEAIKMGAVVA